MVVAQIGTMAPAESCLHHCANVVSSRRSETAYMPWRYTPQPAPSRCVGDSSGSLLPSSLKTGWAARRRCAAWRETGPTPRRGGWWAYGTWRSGRLRSTSFPSMSGLLRVAVVKSERELCSSRGPRTLLRSSRWAAGVSGVARGGGCVIQWAHGQALRVI